MTPLAGGTDPAPPSVRVVEAVARETGTDPIELEPLHDVVDPECLNELFRGRAARGHVAFGMADCRVVVSADGAVDVSPVVDARATGSGSSRD